MKHILSFLIFLLFIIACTKETATNNLSVDTTINVQYSQSTAMNYFATILSKAVTRSQEVRVFLKNTALKEIDNDYDVFYPFVKEEIIVDNMTFRNCLLQYCNETDLCLIEEALPLLTIYVPDLTWIEEDGFNANKWDTSTHEVLVCYMDGLLQKHLFLDGENVAILQSGEGVPMGPSLIIKNNERIRVSPTTKSGETEYEFISPAFDGREKKHEITKRDWRHSGNYSYINIPGVSTTDISNNISASALQIISPGAIQAYNELKSISSSSQRDYLYYGMTATNSIGTLQNNYRDRLFRLRVNPSYLRTICDQTNTSSLHYDPWLYADIDDNGNSSFQPTSNYNAALDLIYSGGRIELEIDQIYGYMTSSTGDKPILNIDPKDLFEIKKIKREQWDATWYRFYRTWVYSFEDSDLLAKWYYPEESFRLPPWSLRTGATSVCLVFREIDSSETSTTTDSDALRLMNDFTQTFNSNDQKIEYGISNDFSTTRTIFTEKKVGSDELGSVNVWYMDPYIVTENTSNGIPVSYTLYSHSTGIVTFSFLPELVTY